MARGTSHRSSNRVKSQDGEGRRLPPRPWWVLTHTRAKVTATQNCPIPSTEKLLTLGNPTEGSTICQTSGFNPGVSGTRVGAVPVCRAAVRTAEHGHPCFQRTPGHKWLLVTVTAENPTYTWISPLGRGSTPGCELENVPINLNEPRSIIVNANRKLQKNIFKMILVTWGLKMSNLDTA